MHVGKWHIASPGEPSGAQVGDWAANGTTGNQVGQEHPLIIWAIMLRPFAALRLYLIARGFPQTRYSLRVTSFQEGNL